MDWLGRPAAAFHDPVAVSATQDLIDTFTPARVRTRSMLRAEDLGGRVDQEPNQTADQRSVDPDELKIPAYQ
jgi:hypothetical protein